MFRSLFGLTLLVAFLFQVQAQVPVSPDKEFWKKRVVRRIDLREKINRPLVNHESHYYDKARFSERDGIVAALFNGLRRQQFVAYDPENWDQVYDYPALVKRMQEFDEAIEAQQVPDFFDDDSTVERLLMEFTGIMEDEEPTRAPEEWGGFRYLDPPGTNRPRSVPTEQYQRIYPPEIEDYKIDYSLYEESLHVVEDWIFNSQRSSMQQNIDYFEIIWTDPTGMLPEKVLARFRWKDVADVLAKTQWKNRFNDAEVRSLKEVFELRIFHGYAIDVGGEPVKTLPEAAKREREIIEFEHNLWSY